MNQDQTSPPAHWIRTLALVGVVFGLAGAVNLFAPLDLVLTALSNKIRAHTVETNMVILEIDPETSRQLGGYPWDDEAFTDLLARIDELGARRIVAVDPFYTGHQTYPVLTRFLEQSASEIFVAVDPDIRPQDIPPDDYLVASAYWKRYWGGIEFAPYAAEVGGVVLPSPNSVLAGIEAPRVQDYPIDYAIDMDSVSLYKVSDLRDMSEERKYFTGRDVIVSRGISDLRQTYLTIGQGEVSLGQIVAVAAATIGAGAPFDVGFVPAWIVAMLVCFVIFSSRRNAFNWGLCSAAVVVFFFLPAAVDLVHLHLAVGHGMFLVITVTIISSFRLSRIEEADRLARHPASGLPSAQRLGADEGTDDRAVFTAFIPNYIDICSGFSAREEASLASAIVATLPGGQAIHHGEAGQFVWLAGNGDPQAWQERFAETSRTLIAGIDVQGAIYILPVAFGIDTRTTVSLSQRLKSSLGAARLAASEQALWKLRDSDAEEKSQSQNRTLVDLDRAMREREISIVLQPKYCLRTLRIVGAEVLARWHHPTQGTISPADFIATAEAGRRIEPLTAYIVREAFSVLTDILRRDPDFVLAINVSPRSIAEPSFEIMLKGALAAFRISARNVMLEITENEKLLGNATAISAMVRLRNLGFSLSIDDYGTGLSTLEYLRDVPASEIKIDRSFIMALTGTHSSLPLVESTISLGQKLGMQVVAEGVEDRRTVELLQQLGCDIAQGYHLARPLKPADMLALLQSVPPESSARIAL